MDRKTVRQAELPWKPAVQGRRSAHQVQVVGLVDGQSLVNVAVRVDVRRHWAVQRQAAATDTQLETQWTQGSSNGS